MASAKMHKLISGKIRRNRSAQQAGQSLLIALAVLFLLGFLGALFSAIVVRNLTNAQSANDTLTTDYFAQAGINYASTMLETSPQGADWRPPLQYAISPVPLPSTFTPTATELGLPAVPIQDPDAQWLNAGYTRYNLNGGRFLLRITYTPYENGTTTSPTAKYLQIDCVGRLGTVASNDPTVYTTTPDLRRTHLIAYKPIGIVDYSRFITNKDSIPDTATLGVPSIYVPTAAQSASVTYPIPPVVTPGVIDINPTNLPTTDPYVPEEFPLVTTYGSSSSYTNLYPSTTTPTTAQALGGGSLRSNMNLRLYGVNNVYLNPTYGDDWEIAGNLTFDNYNATTGESTVTYNQLPAQCLVTVPNGSTSAQTNLLPSNDPNFTTVSGAVRDGSSSNDSFGYPRAIRRLNPPVIDNVDPATNLTRYQELAKLANGEIQVQQSTSGDDSPATIYINNDSDIQRESSNEITGGAKTLRNDWLNPGTSDTGGSWTGAFYNPLGTLITLGPTTYPIPTGSTSPIFGVTLTRSDGGHWTSPTTATTETQVSSQTLVLPYFQQPTSNTTSDPFTDGTGYLNNYTGATYPSVDVVIYATGNIRVRGILSDIPANATTDPQGCAPRHITIVTNGIAYIDGSILKGNPESSITILAKQYVCVNTTQFLAGAFNSSQSIEVPSNDPGSTVGSPSGLLFTASESLAEDGLYERQTGAPYVNNFGSANYALYFSQSSTSSSCAVVNDVDLSSYTDAITGPNTQDFVSTVTPTRFVVGLTATNGAGTQSILAPTNDVPFELTFSVSTNYTGELVLQQAAILPGDIQIQAVLYAQDNSFFVIPGDWFNDDAQDTLTHAADRAAHDQNTPLVASRYPFYGQPIDMQVSIDGALSENVPANISDQAAWMTKWGWIPAYHGYTAGAPEISPHAQGSVSDPTIGIGLNISYDHTAGFPYTFNAGNPVYIRQDIYGRPLPFTPSLPVSPDVLYSGQATN
jgi:hypothetical protein